MCKKPINKHSKLEHWKKFYQKPTKNKAPLRFLFRLFRSEEGAHKKGQNEIFWQSISLLTVQGLDEKTKNILCQGSGSLVSSNTCKTQFNSFNPQKRKFCLWLSLLPSLSTSSLLQSSSLNRFLLYFLAVLMY